MLDTTKDAKAARVEAALLRNRDLARIIALAGELQAATIRSATKADYFRELCSTADLIAAVASFCQADPEELGDVRDNAISELRSEYSFEYSENGFLDDDGELIREETDEKIAGHLWRQ